MTILEAQGLQKIYTTRFGGNQVQALSEVSFSVEKGEYVAIMGESGSGKTTLLNILAALDKPTKGQVYLDGKNLCAIQEKELSAFRRKNLGFVFQDFNLLDTFSIQDNIFLPLVLSGKKYQEMNRRLKPIASKLGITEILAKYPYEVSGGQKQRAAVARALITNPKLILADEPTGSVQLVHYYPKKIPVISPSLLISIFLIIDRQNVLFSSLDNPSYISLNPFCIICSTREKSGAFSCCSSGMLAKAVEYIS